MSATRRSQTNSKFKTTKPVCHTSSLQNGNPPIDSKKSENWGLGSKTGFARCLFPYTHSQTLQKISTLQHFGKKVSIPSSTIRSTIGSKDFHKSDGSSRCVSAKTNDSHIYVPGRLDVKKQQQSKADKTITVHSRIVKKSGFDNQCEKILFSSDSNNRVSGSSDSLKRRSCVSVSRKIQKYKSDDSYIPKFTNSRGTCNVETTWSNGFMHRFSSMGPTAHETTSALSSSLVETSSTQFKSFDSTVSTSPGTSILVAKPKKFFQGSAIRTRFCSSDSSDRCVTVGMGSSYKQLSDSRCLVASVQSKTHQLARTQSCAVSTANISDKSTIQKCASENRQCNCCQLSEQTGRYTTPRPLLLGMGSFEMVYKSQCQNPSCSYSGEKEYYSRCPVKGENDHSFDRMGIKYDNSEFAVPSARNTSNRSVCDFNEQEAASVLLSLAGRNSSVNRCTVNDMDKSICLCIPATDHSKQSITKNTERGLCNFTDSANVAETVVVQSTSQPVNRLSNTTACPTKSIKSKWNFSSKSKCSKSCSLESVKRSYTAKGFSPKIASIISNARKQSTQTVYNARLKIFDSWCQERGINPSTSTVPEIAEFLMFLHTVKNFKPSTLAGYKSAIALIHSSKDRISINMDLCNLIKGLYNINPPIRQLAPNWDLPLVLQVLTKTPFEPLEEAELKYLTLKTVFLMALASAARVSEIHSFTINDKHFRKEQRGIRLLPNMQFLAKTQTLNKPWEPVFIPKFENYATDPKDLLLCPCRALLAYIKRTEVLRKSQRLFVTYQKNHHVEASKNSIARWIVNTVKYAYEHADTDTLQFVRAHDTRKLSTSWALFNGLSSQEILRAAHWSNETTFTSYDLKDVPDLESRFAKAAILHTANRRQKKY
ncbi:uncharacterized protein LOC134722452 [Mytilus trossulus]|uniref:uncharacterized protein LOC134722452 n=1 Tax=Mytilus trossulus TaxID=6551 RepID=UPI0030051F2A